ncbi:MAG TPA: hypothetical protein VG426_16705 [Candidatus Dormibacteraeota bacterium]|nr:hypothetical protein [Candidatus Dormibacteraeota bacterium]
MSLTLPRDVVIPPPRRDRAHRLYCSDWRDAATSTAPAKPTEAGTPMRRQTMITTNYNCRISDVSTAGLL